MADVKNGALVVGYEGRVCRAPLERGICTIPAAVGCSYNRCKFCQLFKHLKYRELPLSDVRAELERIVSLGGDPKSVFLGDGNAFDLPMDRLCEILSMIRGYFPSCENVLMDATVPAILSRNDTDLRRLRGLGIAELYLGIESGLDDVLSMMDKDHSCGEAREAMARARDAGIRCNAHIMTGVAGRGRGMENAEATGRFLVETGAYKVINFSMFVSKKSRLYREMSEGKIQFEPADELENLCEARRLVEIMSEADHRIIFDCSHDFIGTRVKGDLPRDGERMLRHLDEWIRAAETKPPMYAITVPREDLCATDEDLGQNSLPAYRMGKLIPRMVI